ncbi:MAG TPA: trypsin-like peptidase domain-containing protein [Candidatus Acidoferrum sp.]|jgi:serine protease Do|nr:trypsin-like peptidase domain-containing protein [Candidatus Acidoferrum sp.]
MSAFPDFFGKRTRVYVVAIFGLAPWPAARAQTRESSRSANVLRELNESIEDLVQRVSPAVVQILVTGYGAAEEAQRGQADVLVGRRRAIGSGVIVDPEGYIITNAHVVNGAQNIEVLVPPPPAPTASGAAEGPQGRSYQARIVGTSREIDLAVLKIDGHGLPALSIRNSMPPARQGEMVFAFGSPEGLRNTVTMGVVSAVARQPDPDSPLVYIQTDTPINPGNSGGALVNANGDLVGINTFILSSSGGNQGLGFAIPEGVVASAYPQLVKFGHIHQPAIGALVQTITPELAAALRLKRDYGVIISDVSPGGPADTAGLKIQDVVLTVDGVAISSLPQFAQHLYLHKTGDHAAIEILRGADRLKLNVGLAERPHKEDSLIDVADPVKNLVRPLDILGVELTLDLAHELPDLRIPTGVIVAARTLGTRTGEIPLQTGDVIHGLNGTPITSLDGLRAALTAIKLGEPVALQIERHEQIFYVSFTR